MTPPSSGLGVQMAGRYVEEANEPRVAHSYIHTTKKSCELATWTKSKSFAPTENETAFVIGYDIDQDNGRFRIVYSSVKLLSLFRTLDVLSADCTFKTTMQGYPLMVVCLVDKMRHAHPVAFATVTKQEKADYDFVFSAIFDQCSRLGIDCTIKAFINDGEIALKKAARSLFDEQVKMINCYFHVVNNFKKNRITKNKTISAECKETILKNVPLKVLPTQKLHFCEICISKQPAAVPQSIQALLGFRDS
ncbi:uncharacterized protein LOC134223055 [Armigeres subalbatus]|uniref:uncharacterized protein LOC134223055 n=1 Tax=Armigeres subalbatus TaxID=124917 RepID=UPI002ED1DA0C